MARKKKRQWVKKLRQIHPSQFFVKKGRLQRGRVILVVALVGGLALWQTDIQHQRVEATTPVSELPLNELTHEQFIARLAPEAQSLQAQYGVKASISIAQAALESDWGRSELAAKYNNFFGVKASAGMPSVTLSTKEFVNEEWVTVNAAFRTYADWRSSMTDHALLLVNGTSENPQRYQAVLQATDYKTAAYALVSGGYATDPGYAEKIIRMIETYNLNQYDVN